MSSSRRWMKATGLALGLAFAATGWASSAAAQTYVLLTPTEYLFANAARAGAEGVGGALVIRAENAAIDNRVRQARRAFHACHPRCGTGVRQELSLALFQRDLKLLEQSRMEASLGAGFGQHMEALGVLGLAGPGGGVSDRCRRQFDRWTARYNQLMGVRSGGDVFENLLGQIGEMMSGGGGLHHDALNRSVPEYQTYHQCRDAAEIELADAMR